MEWMKLNGAPSSAHRCAVSEWMESIDGGRKERRQINWRNEMWRAGFKSLLLAGYEPEAPLRRTIPLQSTLLISASAALLIHYFIKRRRAPANIFSFIYLFHEFDCCLCLGGGGSHNQSLRNLKNEILQWRRRAERHRERHPKDNEKREWIAQRAIIKVE